MSLQTRADVVTYPQGMDTRSPRVSPRHWPLRCTSTRERRPSRRPASSYDPLRTAYTLYPSHKETLHEPV